MQEENVKIRIVSIRENPTYADEAITYFQKQWANKNSMMVYDDCIRNCINAKASLPQWYLLLHEDKIIGCAGLITNDFISRMDLYPWVCALYIEMEYRGNGYGSLLLEKAKHDTVKSGFSNVYLSTDHVGYYEHYGFYILVQAIIHGEKALVYIVRSAKQTLNKPPSEMLQ